jgi:hypothetical protein
LLIGRVSNTDVECYEGFRALPSERLSWDEDLAINATNTTVALHRGDSITRSLFDAHGPVDEALVWIN